MEAEQTPQPAAIIINRISNTDTLFFIDCLSSSLLSGQFLLTGTLCHNTDQLFSSSIVRIDVPVSSQIFRRFHGLRQNLKERIHLFRRVIDSEADTDHARFPVSDASDRDRQNPFPGIIA
jgi:hypothetical protein